MQQSIQPRPVAPPVWVGLTFVSYERFGAWWLSGILVIFYINYYYNNYYSYIKYIKYIKKSRGIHIYYIYKKNKDGLNGYPINLVAVKHLKI